MLRMPSPSMLPARRLPAPLRKYQINGRIVPLRIRTAEDWKSIPIRDFDWCAVDDDTYDGEGCPIGYGATEEAAIADLIAQIEAEDK